jgi:uncharacterized OB-fold protein
MAGFNLHEGEQPFRIMPAVTSDNEHFWTGGAEGELRFLRCDDCRWWLHPPGPICPECLSKNLSVEAASGKGVVHTFTVNHQQWIPGFDPPYLVAIIDLPEQNGLRLTTNLVLEDGVEPEIGMPVKVVFDEYDGVWIPLFVPAEVAA